MNILYQGFQKLLSDRHTYRQTDTTEIIYHATLQVVNKTATKNDIKMLIPVTHGLC